ncbi:MAG TPA: cupin domain-containing protein [Pseudomonadales bacterium]|nr:cupin domain-containing protein [Pseudomonadales bacterium]
MNEKTLGLLGNRTPQDFIAQYWQKEPLLVRAALPSVAGVIDGNDLAGIACEANGEARLIITDAGEKNWQCEQGPFKAKRFKTLPASHWTLLVQSVDHWIPEIADLLQHFSFLPRWRLDDIMISYATDGGGVGPHFDYYDVFLLQASGTRRWKTGQRCDEHSPLRDHPQMKLLQKFDTKTDDTLQTGDMLYIPAGVAHWGTAMGDDCITISIGFRAASHRDLIQYAMETIAETLPSHQRYRDSTASIDSDPFCINDSAVSNVKAIWDSIDTAIIHSALAEALGVQATESRYPERLADELLPDEEMQALAAIILADPSTVAHSPTSRFAYRKRDEEQAELFVDGEKFGTDLKLAQAICHCQLTKNLLKKTACKQLVFKLVQQGNLIVAD